MWARPMNVSAWKNIVDAQTRLAERFADLRDSRTGPVFFIEHGLSETEAQQLQEIVRQTAKHYPLLDSSWRTTPLPLIVTATEVGYAYRGTGTDFWPRLESALGTKITSEARQRVRDLFVASSSKFRGTEPPSTPWTDAFSLIAWPITHALVPLEFHRQLSAALANLQSNIQELDDDRLQQAVRTAARHPTVRFESFLQDHGYAVSVIRALMGGTNRDVSEDTLSRIDLDLNADRDAQLDITIARRKQQRLRTASTHQAKPKAHELQIGLLRLRLRDSDRLVIEAAFPTIQGSNIEQLRRALRRRRYMFTLWGATSRIPSEQLLSGFPFTLKLLSVPELGAPLLCGLDELVIDTRLIAILRSLHLDFQPPFVFSANSKGDLARIVRGTEISTSQVYWLLAEEERNSPFADLPILGEAGPLTCFRLDPSDEGAAETLHSLGYRLRHSLSVAIVGAPPLGHTAAIPRFLVGDERIVVPGREHPTGMQVSVQREEISLDGNLVRVRVPEGEHVLEISSQGASKQDRFEGVRATINEIRPICWIELCADDKSIQALLGDTIALRVDSLAPLEGLTLTVELDIGGRRSGTALPIGPLPQFLLANEEPWQTLLDKTTREHIVRTSRPIVLHARVGTLAEESWTFERRLRPCWWTRDAERLILDSDHGPIDHGMVSVRSPAAKPAPESSVDMTEGVLLAPLEPNEADFGPVAGFVTYFIAPPKTKLMALHIEKPMLRRSLQGVRGSLGIENLAEAWLRWSLAESGTLTAEIHRRQISMQLDRWLAELACGEIWARREEAVSTLFSDPWKLLAERWLKHRSGLNELVHLTEQEKHEVALLAVAEIQRTHPDLWVRIGTSAVGYNDTNRSSLDDDDYASFDRACTKAYRHLAEQYRNVGRYEFADLFESSASAAEQEEWDTLLESVIVASELRELGELLLPTDTAQSLMSLDLALMSLEEITEEFRLWAVESRSALSGELPKAVTLRTILAFWISPETAVPLDWRNAMVTLMIERPIARAARYLALRARAVRQRGES